MKGHPGTFAAGLAFAVFGLLFLLDALDVWELRLLRLWPVLLIVIGTVIVLGARSGGRRD